MKRKELKLKSSAAWKLTTQGKCFGVMAECTVQNRRRHQDQRYCVISVEQHFFAVKLRPSSSPIRDSPTLRFDISTVNRKRSKPARASIFLDIATRASYHSGTESFANSQPKSNNS
jgi:hypothetical protein